jgi:hypothetical protein
MESAGIPRFPGRMLVYYQKKGTRFRKFYFTSIIFHIAGKRGSLKNVQNGDPEVVHRCDSRDITKKPVIVFQTLVMQNQDASAGFYVIQVRFIAGIGL